MAERGEIRPSPRSLQESVPLLHIAIATPSPIITDQSVFFKSPFWSCVRTYAVWGACPAPILFRLGGSNVQIGRAHV